MEPGEIKPSAPKNETNPPPIEKKTGSLEGREVKPLEKESWAAWSKRLGSTVQQTVQKSSSELIKTGASLVDKVKPIKGPTKFEDLEPAIKEILGTVTLSAEDMGFLNSHINTPKKVLLFHNFLKEIKKERLKNVEILQKGEMPPFQKIGEELGTIFVKFIELDSNGLLQDRATAEKMKSFLLLFAEKAVPLNSQAIIDPLVKGIYNFDNMNAKVKREMWEPGTDFSKLGWRTEALANLEYNESGRIFWQTSRWENVEGEKLENGNRIFVKGDYIIGLENPGKNILEERIHIDLTPVFPRGKPQNFEESKNLIEFLTEVGNKAYEDRAAEIPRLGENLSEGTDVEKAGKFAQSITKEIDLKGAKLLFAIGHPETSNLKGFEDVQDETDRLNDEIAKVAIRDIEKFTGVPLKDDQKTILEALLRKADFVEPMNQFMISANETFEKNRTRADGEPVDYKDLFAKQDILLKHVSSKYLNNELVLLTVSDIINRVVDKSVTAFRSSK